MFKGGLRGDFKLQGYVVNNRSDIHNMSSKRMPEAEVSLRMAFYLLRSGLTNQPVRVAIDGAQVKTADAMHFDIDGFLAKCRCSQIQASATWRASYRHEPTAGAIEIHATPGEGDVIARLRDGRTLRVESKKGPLERTKGSREYPLLREALGQLLTIPEISETDVLAVAVPHSPKFSELAARWRDAPLVRRAKIQIVTVDRRDQVHGLTL